MKTQKKIALCGIVSALCLVSMLLVGVLPMLDYALPAFSGILLILPGEECGKKWGALCFAAVALLSAVLTPVKDSALFFAAFLGWYPLCLLAGVKKIRNGVFKYLIKLAVFLLTIGGAAGLAVFLFRMEAFLPLLEASPLLLFAGALLLVLFVIYDLALRRIMAAYYCWFRPNYLSRIMK